jgi:hypothetical protein
MKLKNPNQVPVGGFAFWYKASSGTITELRAHSLAQLTEKVRLTFLAQNITYTGNLSDIVQHQICLNQPVPAEVCDSSGLGDDLHHKFVAPFLKVAAKVMDSTGIRSLQPLSRLAMQTSHCQFCSGTKVFDPSANNEGRAGNLNSIFPK